MKKLILTILASSFIISCSTDSSTDNGNNPSGGLLPKTITNTYGTSSYTDLYSYNGNKLNSVNSSDGSIISFTYNGDYVINEQSTPPSQTSATSSWLDYKNYVYSNGVLTSTQEHYSHGINALYGYSTISTSYTYNSDGTIVEMITKTNINGEIDHTKNINYYSQGNCIKVEEYNTDVSPMTLSSTTTHTYDNKNFYGKNITGATNLLINVNNRISTIIKDGTGYITVTIQDTYQYNSQNYPTSISSLGTNYYIDSQTGITTAISSTPSLATITYY